jgi:hypothetical protein
VHLFSTIQLKSTFYKLDTKKPSKREEKRKGKKRKKKAGEKLKV